MHVLVFVTCLISSLNFQCPCRREYIKPLKNLNRPLNGVARSVDSLLGSSQPNFSEVYDILMMSNAAVFLLSAILLVPILLLLLSSFVMIDAVKATFPLKVLPVI